MRAPSSLPPALSVLLALLIATIDALGVRPCAAQPSLRDGDKVILESLGTIPGPRWLDGRTTSGTVGLAPAFGRPFSGTTWEVHGAAGNLFTLRNLGDIDGSRWLGCDGVGSSVALSATADARAQWEVSEFGGGTVALRCRAAGQSEAWLDGRTQPGTVGLAPSNAPQAFGGTRWRVHPVRQADVLTQRYDSSRTGSTTAETVLTPALLRAGRFGKLFTRSVEGQIYAQPLYAADLQLPGKGRHNVVFVATTANYVYAFDADDPSQDVPLWRSQQLGAPVPRSDVAADTLIEPLVGITSTPVVDAATGTLYVVAKSKQVDMVASADDLADGDIVTLRSLGDLPGASWLDAHTADKTVALAPAFGGDQYIGTWWAVGRTASGALSFRSFLRWSVDRQNWLDARTADGTVGLAPSDQPPYTGTGWLARPVSGLGFSLQALGDAPGPAYLDGRTADGTVGLAPSADPSHTGARWSIQRHSYHNRLYALDVLSGATKRTADIGGSSSGVAFLPKQQLNRPGLLLLNGVVYIAFGAHADALPYNGWVFAYRASDFQPMGAYVVPTPQGSGAGIWQSGSGLAADSAGRVYAMTGNGAPLTNPGPPQPTDMRNSFIQLRADQVSRTLRLDGALQSQKGQSIDLNLCDLDLSSAGPVHIPSTTHLIGAGKQGVLYNLDGGNLQSPIQAFGVATDQWGWKPRCGAWVDVEMWPHVHGSPAVWPTGGGTASVYVWPERDRLKAYRFRDGRFDTTPFGQSVDVAPSESMPGGILAVSADAANPDSGVVWAARPADCPPGSPSDPPGSIANMDQRPCNGQFHSAPGILKAFDAQTLQELWNSGGATSPDALGLLAKFNPPTVAHGRVYVGTFGSACTVESCPSSLVVYGVRPGT